MEKNYLAPLTWLRGIAAFFVVVAHTIRICEDSYGKGDTASYFLPLNLLDQGAFAVYLFFALSGCTLFLSNSSKVKNLKDIPPFFFKRFMRIWPSFAVSLLIYIVYVEIFKIFYIGDKAFKIADFLKSYNLTNIFQYLSLSFNVTGPSGLFNTVYWTLPVEFQYYMLLPFALLGMRGKLSGIIIPCVFGGFLYLCYIYAYRLPVIERYEFFSMGFSFFGGVLVAFIFKIYKPQLPISFCVACFAIFVLLTSLLANNYIFIPNNIPFINNRQNCYGVIAVVCVSLALYTKPIKVQSIFFDILHRYGEISYSIYLYHMIFIGISVLFIVNFEIYGGDIKLFFVFINTLFGSYFFSLLTYKYIEQPSIALGKKWN